MTDTTTEPERFDPDKAFADAKAELAALDLEIADYVNAKDKLRELRGRREKVDRIVRFYEPRARPRKTTGTPPAAVGNLDTGQAVLEQQQAVTPKQRGRG